MFERRTGEPGTFLVGQFFRAACTLVIGLIVTFSSDHSVMFGMVVLFWFTVLTGAGVLLGAFGLSDRVVRGVSITQAAVCFGFAALAVFLPMALPETYGTGLLLVLLSSFAAVTGALEIYLGMRGRAAAHPATRDWFTVGVLTALFAMAVVLIPADFAQPWEVDSKEGLTSGVLTADIIAVGSLGAYAVVVGVLLGIGAFTGFFARRDSRQNQLPEPTPASTNGT